MGFDVLLLILSEVLGDSDVAHGIVFVRVIPDQVLLYDYS